MGSCTIGVLSVSLYSSDLYCTYRLDPDSAFDLMGQYMESYASIVDAPQETGGKLLMKYFDIEKKSLGEREPRFHALVNSLFVPALQYSYYKVVVKFPVFQF